jgi:hypothetical protein
LNLILTPGDILVAVRHATCRKLCDWVHAKGRKKTGSTASAPRQWLSMTGTTQQKQNPKTKWPEEKMDRSPVRTQQQPAADTAGAVGPKACATCRLAHGSCDRSVLPPSNPPPLRSFFFSLFFEIILFHLRSYFFALFVPPVVSCREQPCGA